MTQTQYWTIPGNDSRFATLPHQQIAGQPIPTTWAGVGETRARELGAVRHQRDDLPEYYNIPDGVDPYTTATNGGIQVHTLDLDLCEFDAARAAQDHAQAIRKARDGRIEAVRWRVERAQSEQRLGMDTTDDLAALDAYLQALRDIPQQTGFPWDGDVAAAPWPDAPWDAEEG